MINSISISVSPNHYIAMEIEIGHLRETLRWTRDMRAYPRRAPILSPLDLNVTLKEIWKRQEEEALGRFPIRRGREERSEIATCVEEASA